jgi:hypothetical protein
MANLVARNANEAMVGSGVRPSVLCSCVWQEFGFSLLEDVFMFDTLYNEMLKFNAIFKNNAAVNSITVQHKTVSFPSTLTGHTLG